MGRIVVKSKKKVRFESESGSVRFGTRTTCEVTLRDPIAAEIHCTVSFTPQGFAVEDGGASTGTYVNGLRVTGSQVLADGDEVVLGVTKLVVAHERDGEIPVLAIDLQEDKFFQKAKMSTGDTPTWIPGDREAFKEAEINFGAFPALRFTGWSAVLVGILLIVVLAVPKLRGMILKPGPIHNLHAQQIEAGNCSACHLSTGDDGRFGCAVCHEAELKARHPFAGTVGFAVAEQACTRCHVEHLGTVTESKVIEGSGGAKVRVRDPRFVPPNFREVVGCEECHRSSVPGEAEALRRLARERSDRAPEAGESESPVARSPQRMDQFSHAAHVGVRSIACDKCHLAGGAEGRDFAPVAFTTCMTCHHDDANLAYSAEEVTPDEEWVGLASNFRIDSHGQAALSATGNGDSDGSASEAAGSGDEEDKCQLCHTSGSNRRMNSFERPVFMSNVTGKPLPTGDGTPDLVFTIETRGHEGLTQKVDCSKCHYQGTLASRPRSDRRFFHGLHLSRLVTGSSTELDSGEAQALSTSCAECHLEMMGASQLGGKLFDVKSCKSCHGSDSNRGGVPRVSVVASSESATRFDFPHSLHVGSTKGPLAQGCFACHEFQSTDDELLAVPTTRPGVANCLECHTNHQYTEGGSCSNCHSASFKPAPDNSRTGSVSFSHFDPGHASMLSDCNRCHEGVADANRVPEIGMPETTDSACFKCHFKERFHWR